MKSNQSSKNFKSARVLTIVICIGLAFSFATVSYANAYGWFELAEDSLFGVGGIIVGWFMHDRNVNSNVYDNPALELTEENLLNAWRATGERISNQYKENNVDVQNFVNLFNLSYLYWVRQAENEVASVISYDNWYDAKNNMSCFDNFDDALEDLILSQIAKYSAQDIYVFRDILETNGKDTVEVKVNDGDALDSSFTYGLRPMVTDRNTEWYLVNIYIPAGLSLKVDGNLYNEGIYQFGGEKHTISEVTSDSILITGFPTDYDIFTKKDYNISDIKISGYTSVTDSSAYPPPAIGYVYINRKIDKLSFDNIVISGSVTHAHLSWTDSYGNSHDIPTSGDVVVYPHAYVESIKLYAEYWGAQPNTISFDELRADINYSDIFYRPEPVTITVDTSLAGNVELAEHLTDRDMVNFYDMIIPYMKTLKNSMELNAQTLFNLYHSHGWFDTDDIPSEYLVVMPDLLFDNIYAIADINITEAMLIYYTLLKQLDNETLWANPDIDSSDITISDFGKWMVKAKLIHASDTIFDNKWVWVIPQSESLSLENNTDISLTQSVMFFIPATQEIFMGYSGDTLHIYSLLEDGESTENVTITRQSLSEFLIATYGFDISLFGEWEFPELIENVEIYMSIAIGCIVSGIIIAVVSSGKYKKYRPIGYLLIIIGSGIIIYFYVIPVVQSFLDSLVFF